MVGGFFRAGFHDIAEGEYDFHLGFIDFLAQGSDLFGSFLHLQFQVVTVGFELEMCANSCFNDIDVKGFGDIIVEIAEH